MSWFARIASALHRHRAPLLHVASDVGEGPVVVLLHGIASSASTFRRVIPQLEGRYRCISLELLGFGGSPAPAGATYTIEEHVASIAATIRSLSLREPFILVGHSLGSLLAARYAAQNPARVSRLVLVSPPVYLSPTELGDPRARSQVELYLRLYEFLRANKDLTIASATALSRLLRLGSALEVNDRNWDAFILSLKNCIESQTTVSDISRVAAPVDVVYGGLDQFIAPATLRIIGTMRHVTMHRVDVGDHLVRTRIARELVSVIG
ncbi:pimeloyl-ACP methyl ester carboxylesterase [Microbacteriaceae bacterium SG_E_30_P1]|uniref:Pimeloyl-ACP methyl ester carboxylesterase n=1 Tax=Antiquaquibacter oligotrophicus TaxID=2880260 RepID=A0ABT6KJN7_9MICO|nr:alpha/beta hydrolase [Antiquaquibacter oligotrophicus]MDH6180217.1 pimeloyl-ACP methyl ester carboxylesterase [Antiquaquibacter oligotrophicus]UDF14036.1 alpha/beta hydrolase [Antiquaquibacter oligotrophicus]